MKRIYLFSILLMFAAGSFAQNVLTYSNNALVTGDSTDFSEIQYVDPGSAGPNQIWDFSKIQFTGKHLVSRMPATPSQELSGVGDYNILLNDGGYEYYFYFTQKDFEERGYTNKETTLSMVYSDPLVKMQYPFSFGQQFIDEFAGTAKYKWGSKIDITGEQTVSADAFGTLILPDRVIQNTLRLKVVKEGLQRNVCGSTEVRYVKYLWYAAGYRYPVFHISVMEYQRSGALPVVTKTASVSLNQQVEKDLVSDFEQLNNESDDPDISVILFPNPFTEKLTYNYFIRKQLPVTIVLCDMAGNVNVRLAKNQLQGAGLHTGELDAVAYTLQPGVYFLRFTFDRRVIVKKVIKL